LIQFSYSRKENIEEIHFESKQYLDIRKLKSSFKKLGIIMSSSRMKKFFRRYNTSGDGKLSLHQFLDIFIPKKLGK
jgi:Ca2+-binding EF-hand superfamily protein